MQVVEELFTYWNLDSTDEACEELEEALIVSACALHVHPIASCWCAYADLHTVLDASVLDRVMLHLRRRQTLGHAQR